MGGHGSTSGYSKAGGSTIVSVRGDNIDEKANNLYDMYSSGKISSEQYTGTLQKLIADEQRKNASISNLPGINGNPWPPDADGNHLQYTGGGVAGIRSQFGDTVSEQTAGEMYDAVRYFTGYGYGDVRDAQSSGATNSFAGVRGQRCEEFIAAGVASGNGWNGGPTYRGIEYISDDAFKAFSALQAGDTVDPNFGGTASWSTNKDIAFAGFSGGKNSVVFVHAGSSQPMGVSVDRISSNSGEMEVMVSKDSRYRVQHVETYAGQGGPDGVGISGTNYLLVYVEDA